MSLFDTLTSYLFPAPPIPPLPSPDDPTTSTFVLESSRTLTFSTYGSPTGPVILYQHGFPGSRLEAQHLDAVAKALGLRIIALDRPGHGGSTRYPGAGLLDWAADVEAVVDGLGLGRVGVLGVSGGGPSALALAYALPAHKIAAVTLVCGMGPPDIGMRGADVAHRLGWPYGIRIAPYWLGRMFWRSQAIGRLDLPEAERVAMMVKEGAKAAERDREIFTEDLCQVSVRASAEAFRQGYDGVWDDGSVSCKPWGFRVQDIRKDLKVQLWYGKEDYNVPHNHGVQIKARLGANAELKVKDETHAGIFVHWRMEFLEGLKNMMEEEQGK